MKNKPWKNYAFWIAVTEIVGLIAGLISRKGTELYSETIIKPPLSPPALLFPIVWVLLYAVMGIGAAKISLSRPSETRRKALYIYIAQLAVNFFWSIIFFNFQAFAFAYVWLLALWGLIVLMILSFRKLDKTAAYLQIPYLVWVSFAGYLNLGVWLLNR
ncbi:MAG: tryptophan-rich sensory protein [Ruminococcaceae bacterium]|nr:tryptophan-rich sensory protein [Oscillospiraceae bacterium]